MERRRRFLECCGGCSPDGHLAVVAAGTAHDVAVEGGTHGADGVCVRLQLFLKMPRAAVKDVNNAILRTNPNLKVDKYDSVHLAIHISSIHMVSHLWEHLNKHAVL